MAKATLSSEANTLAKVLKRLDILVGVTLNAVGKQSPLTMKEKIRMLKSLGLGPSEIGRVLGVSTNYVTAQLSQQKKKLPPAPEVPQ